MNRIFVLSVFLLLSGQIFGQTIVEKISSAQTELATIEKQRQQLNEKLENLKLEKIQFDLNSVGLPALYPGDELIKHSAIQLAFAPEYKQARWVAHIILPDVINGVVFRTNDFRVDSSVKAGSAVEADYFLKSINEDSVAVYDGFGYDRGHLAPSADFRWSKKALSESYFYSNMSPQVADFNRGGWGELEDAVRGYIYRNPTSQLYVFTGPFLEKDLPVITRGVNKVPIPKKYFKVIVDLEKKRGIGFIMPNQAINKPLKSYAVSIKEVEKQTGLDFFSKVNSSLQQEIEQQTDTKPWLPEKNGSDAEPLSQEGLPRNHFNTLIAKESSNKNNEIYVCGTVVGARISRAGNILLNLDKQFPNQIFTVFIKKEDIANFNYKPEEFLKGKIVCFKGKVIDLGGTPAMYIKNESFLKVQ